MPAAKTQSTKAKTAVKAAAPKAAASASKAPAAKTDFVVPPEPHDEQVREPLRELLQRCA